jgi:hypothetical protein
MHIMKKINLKEDKEMEIYMVKELLRTSALLIALSAILAGSMGPCF